MCNACHQSKIATLFLVHGRRVDERFVWFSWYDISVLCWIMYFYNQCVWCLFWSHSSWFLLLFCPPFGFPSCMNTFWISRQRIQLWERHILYLWIYRWLSFFYQKIVNFQDIRGYRIHFYRPKSPNNRHLFVFDMWNCQCLWIMIWPCHGICSWSYCDENRTWVFLTDLEYLCPSKRVWLLLLFCELGQDCHERFCCLRMLALNCVYIIFFHQ